MNIVDSSILGSFHVDCGKVRVSDPCYAYAYDRGCCTVENVLDGEYVALVEYAEDTAFGTRVSCLIVIHYDYLDEDDKINYMEMHEVSVDSGQMSIFDNEFYRQNYRGDFYDLRSFYGRICNMTLGEDLAGMYDDKGVASSSGYGDGVYLLKVGRNKRKQAVAFLIEFIRIDEEEEDEDDVE